MRKGKDVQRIYNLDKWRRLDADTEIHFAKGRPRTVRIEVNAPQKTALYVSDKEGECAFLALVEGRETVEFSAPGEFRLQADDPVMILTADGDDISFQPSTAPSFTRIVERRVRNPDLELMMAKAHANMERRFAEQLGEFQRRLERGMRPSTPQPQATADAGSVAAKPASAGDADASDPPAAGTGGGSEGDAGPGAK